MYYKQKYKDHNDALFRFMKKFNNVSYHFNNELKMYLQKNENYRDDGGIVYLPGNVKLLYDFEKRHSYYYTFGKFPFKELGQFERKIAKQEIQLSIQCSKDETGFVYAWHDDFRNEQKQFVKSKTSTGFEENAKRFTSNFEEINYKSMADFYGKVLFWFKSENFKYNKKITKQFELF